MARKAGKFQFAIDRGGTFTDVFARCPGGKIRVLKLLSEDPQNYKDAPTEGIRRVLQEVWSILYKPNEAAKLYYHEKQMEALKLTASHLDHRQALHAKKRFDSNLSDSKITERFIRQLPQRPQMKSAPRHWIVEDLRPFIIKPVQDLVDESQPVEYLTEMRDVTIQFINIVPLTYYEPSLVELVDKAFQIVCKIAGDALGVVNKVSLFDKDAMILVLFGLRAINHEMESQNALRSAFKIRNAITQLKDVKSTSVGVTNGFVYCGVVGHPMRREYTVIGGAVNKAARIMCTYLDKVTCDHKTFRRSKLSSYYFQLQSVMKLKGIEEAGNIFEYNENFDTASTVQERVLPVVGRSLEYSFIKAIIQDNAKNKYYGICFYGASKLGKSTILSMALISLKKTKKYTIASIALDGSGLIPYFCISKLYRQLYDQRTTIFDDDVEIINLPRDLWNFYESQNEHEDVALQKYRILNYFRDITRSFNRKLTLLFIDNLEHIDQQSWEILDITLSDGYVRLISSSTFDEKDLHFKFKLSLNNHIQHVEVTPIADKYVAVIACQLLSIYGIPNLLVNLLIRTCEGRPGYIQCCLLRLVNNGSVELELITKNDNIKDYIFPPEELLGYTSSLILPVIKFSDKYKRNNDDLTLAAISLDLFDSFTPYQQLVIKTGAVLGDLFTRTLLIVALKYPTELTLAKVIEELFQEEILECGARYIYAMELDNTLQICCRCYFEEEFYTNLEGLPKYAFCKILHFKNKSIRDVAYDLLPSNQRTELHLLCTDVLENINNKCPNCLRNPINNFINFGKFKHLMNYCNHPENAFVPMAFDYDDYDDLKVCIRACMRQNVVPADVIENKTCIRPVFDPKMCNCFDILARVFKDLIYHSHRAGHLGKQIFFTMKYGLLLILMKDFTNAITMLTEARELCFNEDKIQSTSLTGTFKKVIVGKIEIGLAKTFLEIRQLRATRNHLAIALRQYNIPSVSLAYRYFNKLLTRSFLVNNRRVKPYLYKNTVIRNDLAACLNICTKLFLFEGHWNMAKLTSAYSLYLLRTINTKVELLCESYCNAIDIARYTQDTHICEKLQKYAVKEIQLNYSNNLTYNLYTLNTLLGNVLEIGYLSGNIDKAIRIGYRVLDISLKLSSMIAISHYVTILSLLLLYNFRISDCGDVARILKVYGSNGETSTKLLMYHSLNLIIYRRAGFIFEPLDVSLEFASNYFARKIRFSWEEYLLMALLHVHYLMLGNYERAEDWRHSCSFNPINVRRRVVFTTLMFTIEAKILLYLRSRRMNSANLKIEEKVIASLMKLASGQIKHFPIMLPFYSTLSAWLLMLKNKKRKAYKILQKAQNISQKYDNYLYYALIIQLKNAWSGGFYYNYSNRPVLGYKEAVTFSPTAWAQYMSPYPLY